LAVAVGVLAVCLSGCPTPKASEQPSATPAVSPAAAGGEIVLGAYFGSTGGFATFGQSSVKAIRLATDEINAAGGILGKQIKLVVEDDQCKPEEAATASQKLIQQDKVACVIGEVASSNSLAAAPICQKNQTPMVSPSSTNPAVTATGDYIFRVCFTDDFQGKVMARFASEKLKAKTAVIFSDVSSDYSKGLSQVFREVFTAGGGKILGEEESYTQGDKDFRAQLTKFKQLNPDVMYVPGYYNEVSLILSQAKELGLKATVLGGDGFDSPKLVEVAGKAADGCYFSNHYSKDDPNPVVQKFVTDFKAKYGEVPDALAACAYDALRIVVDAIKAAGTPDRTAIRDALAKTKDFDGVTGKITIDENRNARKPATVLTIKDGKQTFVQSMPPA
jgi:branched-chain amino acid transport system substrate-binding protein